jgi:hypothetical protein
MPSPFTVDFASSDDQYFYVDIPSCFATVVIKIEDDGVETDIWPLSCMHAPAATAHALTADLCDDATADPPPHPNA